MDKFRLVRNIVFAMMMAVSLVGLQRRVFAASCDDTYGSQYINFVNCGPFDYENDALDWMDSTAQAICPAYAYYYWHVRVGDFSGPGYYDGMWTCG